MLDSETAKKISEIFEEANSIESPKQDITLSTEASKQIADNMSNVPTPLLCVMHTFMCMELKKRNIHYNE